MKKYLSIFLTFILIFSLAACSQTKNDNGNDNETESLQSSFSELSSDVTDWLEKNNIKTN